MYTHPSSCLQGPVTRDRGWWTFPNLDPMPNLAPDDLKACDPLREKSIAGDEPIRTELVERIRREIAEGTYDTPDKWEIALDRLFHRLEIGEK
jgi:hypothetical protein